MQDLEIFAQFIQAYEDGTVYNVATGDCNSDCVNCLAEKACSHITAISNNETWDDNYAATIDKYVSITDMLTNFKNQYPELFI